MRIRTIKPSFFLNDELANCSPLARLFFIGLWCTADCQGRLEIRPKRLKAEILPFDDCDVLSLLQELQTGGFIRIYEADGFKVCQIDTFRRHQRISGTEASTTSKLPAPTNSKEILPASVAESPQPSSQEGVIALEGRKEGRKGTDSTHMGPGRETTCPRLEEALLMAHTQGIPQDCAEKWWNDNDARGWRDSRGIPIAKWESSLRGYFVSWRSFHQKHLTTNQAPQPKGDPFWKAKTQLDLVSGEIKAIEDRTPRDAVGTMMISDKDRPNLMQLRKQRVELKKQLGLTQ